MAKNVVAKNRYIDNLAELIENYKKYIIDNKKLASVSGYYAYLSLYNKKKFVIDGVWLDYLKRRTTANLVQNYNDLLNGLLWVKTQLITMLEPSERNAWKMLVAGFPKEFSLNYRIAMENRELAKQFDIKEKYQFITNNNQSGINLDNE